MPFGVHSGGTTWQEFIRQVIGAELEPNAFAYLGDIFIVTKSFEKHLEVLSRISARLRVAGITLIKDKCNFCKPEMKYLGYVINKSRLRVDLQKLRQ